MGRIWSERVYAGDCTWRREFMKEEVYEGETV